MSYRWRLSSSNRRAGEAFYIHPAHAHVMRGYSIEGECRVINREGNMEKSHVGMEARCCIVCGHQYETGNILLNTKLKATLERVQLTGWGPPCPDCDEKLGHGTRIALVEVKARPGWARTEMKPDEGNRTGKIAYIDRALFRAIFNADDTREGKPLAMVWVDEGTVERLEEIQRQSDIAHAADEHAELNDGAQEEGCKEEGVREEGRTDEG